MIDITEKLQRVLQTMTNDDKSAPRSPNRERFVERSNLLLECISALNSPPPRSHVMGSFLPTEDGEFNGNVPEFGKIDDVLKTAERIIQSVCELQEMPQLDDPETIVINVNDLRTIVENWLERAALSAPEAEG